MVGGMDPTERDSADAWAESLAAVIGGNCKRIRTAAGVTQDELARYARDLGLRWNASKVADFEAGRAAPTFATVLTASLALDHSLTEAALAGGGSAARVTLADLVSSGKWVALNDALRFRGGDLADVCRGEPWKLSRDHFDRQFKKQAKKAHAQILRALGSSEAEQRERNDRLAWELFEHRSGLAEQRLAERLDISRERLAGLSYQLWQHPFKEERDQRAGPGANRQKRGQVSRTLQAELEKALADGND